MFGIGLVASEVAGENRKMKSRLVPLQEIKRKVYSNMRVFGFVE